MSYILVFFAISLPILLHESGHFLAAKWVGIPVSRFSIGFGGRLWGFKRNNTEYRLSLIPCGGYVLPALEDEQAYYLLPLRERIAFALSKGSSLSLAYVEIC